MLKPSKGEPWGAGVLLFVTMTPPSRFDTIRDRDSVSVQPPGALIPVPSIIEMILQ